MCCLPKSRCGVCGFAAQASPSPNLNVAVRDRHGRWLGYGDFVWPAQRVVAEYDGDYHFTVDQRRKDQQRRRAMRDAGWIVLEINGADNRTPAPMLLALERALGIRPERP